MDIVLIKLFRNDIECADYHDIMIDDYDEKIKELHKYGKEINKKILFTVINSLSPVLGDCFAEVTANCILTKQEKKHFIEIIKYFCGDAKIKGRTMDTNMSPLTVLFSKTQFDDIYEI